jgi:RsiW-degrading membrane proteinase PrsW (M82 family)
MKDLPFALLAYIVFLATMKAVGYAINRERETKMKNLVFVLWVTFLLGATLLLFCIMFFPRLIGFLGIGL